MLSEVRDLRRGFALLQYGNVMAWGRTIPNAETALLPSGEGAPPLDHWLGLLGAAETIEDVRQIVERATRSCWRGAAAPTRRRTARPSRI
jgi:hypothetical protein